MSPLSQHKTPHRILILVPIDWEWGRDLVRTVRHYAFTTGQMEVGNVKLQSGVRIADMVKRQKIDGIIATVRNRELEAELLALGIPVINISNFLHPSRLPLVTQDDRTAGRLAARHLLGCGCSTLAYWGQQGGFFSQERIAGFVDEAKKIEPSIRILGREGRSLVEDEGEPLLRQMRPWVKTLPPKTGVFAVLDPFALHLLQVAREQGRAVPQELAVLGVGDDDFWVNFENIPLSSVKLPVCQVGEVAASLLNELITQRKQMGSAATGAAQPSSLPVARYLAVDEISVRQSTDVRFIDDVAVARALDYIRRHAAKNIYVPDVVRASGISRSGLQRRFAKYFNYSLLKEIQMARIERVKVLLRTSDMKITEIAEACDFPDTPRMHVLFRQHTGEAPGAYRKRFRKY